MIRSKDKRPSSNKRGYGERWRRHRIVFLRANPLCAECQKMGIIKAAKVIDHIKSHKGDMNLFWDETNWQPLCVVCHNKKTGKEDGAFGNHRNSKDIRGCDFNGMPLHEDHPWHK